MRTKNNIAILRNVQTNLYSYILNINGIHINVNLLKTKDDFIYVSIKYDELFFEKKNMFLCI